ncbi:MAG TPA: SDR family oxidoreductase [Nocardioides sp.]|uniref:SDR family oxidoreductase n=1 Tax=Nocardioides sp. TaxID=35761 RepID=UPI002BFD3DC5|nr:SDR family oxidoreductase [Nocardioides sp.]HTW15336.1 SDR family oxidoreductase [Nocardioides sp.]
MAFTIDLTDQVVLVTGGARGVGDGIVRTYLAAGAHVEICGRSTPESLTEVDGRSPHFSAVDVREADQVSAWIEDVAARRGRIDVVVNNAGGAPFSDFAAGSPRFHAKINDLNFMSAVHVMHAAYPHLKQAEHGVVVNITSISARRPSPGTAVYGAAKAALESLTGSLAVEWAPDVRVNAVSCGLVATPGSVDHYGDAEQFAKVAATIPRGVLATPEEIGQACLLLTSPLASHITGAVLDVDGGGEWPAFLQHTPNA